MQVRSLSWEDTLEEGMASHSSILAWRIPWTEKPGRLQSIGSHRIGRNLTRAWGRKESDILSDFTSLHLTRTYPRLFC